MATLRIIELAIGEPSRFDGMYVKAYDPTYVLPDRTYDGGILEVTADPKEALQFADAGDAMEKWREPYGVRVDGKPNRPLTAWTVEVCK